MHSFVLLLPKSRSDLRVQCGTQVLFFVFPLFLQDSWEIVEGLRGGFGNVMEPQKQEGYLLKRRKWPMKGWHKVKKKRSHRLFRIIIQMDKQAWGFLASCTSRLPAALKSADVPRPSNNLIEWASPPAPAEESHAGPQGSMLVSTLGLKSFQCDDAAHMSGWSPLGCISQPPLGLMVRHAFSIDLPEEISGWCAGREARLEDGEGERFQTKRCLRHTSSQTDRIWISFQSLISVLLFFRDTSSWIRASWSMARASLMWVQECFCCAAHSNPHTTNQPLI